MLRLIAVSILSLFFASCTVANPSTPPPASFSEVIENVTPEVVQIFAEKEMPDDGGGKSIHQIMGSGYIYNDQGIVITNFHIAGDSKVIRITSRYSPEIFPATFVSGDASADVALIKINNWKHYKDTRPFGFVKFRPSLSLKIGDPVFALGHPLNLGYSVSRGIVSAPIRSYHQGGDDLVLLQTDTKIINGNSGGPLFDMEGNVVGMNTMVLANTFGMALSSEFIKKVVIDLLKNGKVDEIDPGMMLSFEDTGTYFKVEMVADNMPAMKAGLQAGDLLVSVGASFMDGRMPLREFDTLRGIIRMASKGDVIYLTVKRGDKTLEVKMPL